MSFDWSEDTFFNKWMDNFVHSKKLVIEETNDEEMDQDDMQETNTSVQVGEDKEEKLASGMSTVV